MIAVEFAFCCYFCLIGIANDQPNPYEPNEKWDEKKKRFPKMKEQ